jgi:hypothetical protein
MPGVLVCVAAWSSRLHCCLEFSTAWLSGVLDCIAAWSSRFAAWSSRLAPNSMEQSHLSILGARCQWRSEDPSHVPVTLGPQSRPQSRSESPGALTQTPWGPQSSSRLHGCLEFSVAWLSGALLLYDCLESFRLYDCL